jgi:hypothetical protein
MRLPWPGALSPNRAVLLGAVAAGLLLGVAAWFSFGSTSSAADRLEQARERIGAARPPRPRPAAAPDLVAQAGAHPLFALTTGPGAVPDVTVALEGVSRSSNRSAALLSINGGAAQWLERGKSLDGVALIAVGDAKVTLETALGPKEVELGATPPPPAGPGSLAQAPAGQPGSAPPPGFRLPPPPASAPRP